jgi:hypothetical protein
MTAGILRLLVTIGITLQTLSFTSDLSAAPSNPRIMLYQLIEELQSGRADLSMCAPGLRELIVQRTGTSGIFEPLAGLGPVLSISLDATIPMARGTAYTLTAAHKKGKSNWQIGVSAVSNLIVNLEFRAGGKVFSLVSVQSDDPKIIPRRSQPEPSATPPLRSAPTPVPSVDNSPACQKFPNLC